MQLRPGLAAVLIAFLSRHGGELQASRADDSRVFASIVANESVTLAERIEACRLLQTLGPAAEHSVPTLIKVANDAMFRGAIGSAGRPMRPDDPQAPKVLEVRGTLDGVTVGVVIAQRDATFDLRFAAVDALAAVGINRPNDVVPELRKALSEVPLDYRRHAALRASEPQFVPEVDAKDAVRYKPGMAVVAAPPYGRNGEARPEHDGACDLTDAADLQNMAITLINALGKFDKAAAPAIPEFLMVLQGRLIHTGPGGEAHFDCNSQARAAAAAVLTNFRDQQPVHEALTFAKLAGKYPQVKSAAESALNGTPLAPVSRMKVQPSGHPIVDRVPAPPNGSATPQPAPPPDPAAVQRQLMVIDDLIAKVEKQISKIDEDIREAAQAKPPRLTTVAALQSTRSLYQEQLADLREERRQLQLRPK